MFNWGDIRFFLELARQQQLSAAAGRLKVDTSTVSRRVLELEKALKRKLFERTAQGFTLSEEGQKLLALAERMEYAAAEITSEMADGGSSDRGVVRVATMEALATMVVAPQWAAFRRSAPNIGLELMVVFQPTNLGRREADISLTMMRLDSPRLNSQRIGKFAVNLYGSARYLEEHGVPKPPSDLRDHCFIDYLDAFVSVSEVRWLRELAPEAHIVMQSTSLIAQQQAAIAGIGLAALPAYAAPTGCGLVKVMPQKTIWRDLWMTVHADNEYLSRIKAAAQFLKAQIPSALHNGDP